MDKSIVNEVVSALEAVKSYGQPGFWIILSILIVLVLVIAAVMYQRIVINRFQTASKAVVISGCREFMVVFSPRRSRRHTGGSAKRTTPGLDLNLLRPVRDAMSTRKKTHDFIFPNKIPCCVQMRSI